MKNKIKKLELLAPAKDLKVGIAAVNAGADAVYIGGPKFGARSAVGNSLKDIEELVKYAHQFYVKIYVTINTILYDKELDEAKDLIWKLYDLGVDGIIIQDMGILEMDLPPIPLIASTQMDNYSLERIKFLEKIGLKRVILARELSLEQIKEIKDNTDLELESFVHGALCVSFSGRCYMSQFLSGRSANRGECIQACRLPYTLIDGDDKVIVKNKPLLCLKDFNLSENLEELIDAGVTSFKIEGRLKDEDYVTNVVYYYRKKLDEIILRRNDLEKSSSGVVLSDFVPDLEKTFNRSYTTYFLKGRQKDILSSSPKSKGKLLGKVKSSFKDYFILDNDAKVNNGDGICFFGKDGEMKGSNVNVVDGKKMFLNDMSGLFEGMEVYRNLDTQFLKDLRTERKISISFLFKEDEEGFSLKVSDKEGNSFVYKILIEKKEAEKKELAEDNLRVHLGKLGGTSYMVKDVKIEWSKPYFIPVSELNKMRRKTIEGISLEREKNYKREEFKIEKNDTPFITNKLSCEFNVSNKLAMQFYNRHGVKEIEPAFEIGKGKKLMTTKHCLKYCLGFCPKDGGKVKEPLCLINEKGRKFLLKFNCIDCQMEIQVGN